MPKKEAITVQGTEIAVLTTGYTINFLSAWEKLHNPVQLNATAITQMKSLDGASITKRLE